MSEANKNMISCPTCGEEIAKSAKSCPKCGAKIKKPWYKKWWIWVIAVVVIAGVGSSGSDNDKVVDRSTPTVSNMDTQDQGQGSDNPEVSVGTEDSTVQVQEEVTEAATVQETQTQAPPVQEQTPAPQVQEAAAPQSTPSSDSKLDTVLWENNGIRIIYKGIEENFMGIDIKLLVENNSSSNTAVSVDSLDINGYSFSTLFYADVTAGKKTNDSISIFSSELNENGIDGLDGISQIDIVFEATNTTTYDTVTSDMIQLTY